MTDEVGSPTSIGKGSHETLAFLASKLVPGPQNLEDTSMMMQGPLNRYASQIKWFCWWKTDHDRVPTKVKREMG